MELVLRIEDKDKTFVAPFISARMLRRTIEIGKNTDFENMDVTGIDQLVDYIVEIFGKQFTRDEFYDGIEAKGMIKTIIACINEVIGKVNETTGSNDPNA